MLANQLPVRQQKPFSLAPRSLEEAMQFAKLISTSDFCPKEHRGKPGNVLVAVQYGAELGLSPLQALQSIAIINGKPCIYGDALLGIVMANPSFMNIHEETKNGTATCTICRKNKEPVIRTFSKEDAKRANLLGKVGPWTSYEARMLQMRARGFALRDSFADVLKGIITREEAEDYEVNIPKQSIKAFDSRVVEVKQLSEAEMVVNDEIELKADVERINGVTYMEELKEVYMTIMKERKGNKEYLTKIYEAKEKRKEELEQANDIVKEFNAEIDAATGEVLGG